MDKTLPLEIKQEIKRELLRQFAWRELSAAASVPIGYAILVLALYGSVKTSLLVYWFSLQCLLESLNVWQAYALAKSAERGPPQAWRINLLTLCIFGVGVSFGLTPIILAVPNNPLLQLFNITVLAVGATLAVPSLCLHPPAQYSFAAALLLPSAAMQIGRHDVLALPLGVGCIVLLILCVVFGYMASKLTSEGIAAMVRNRFLVDQMIQNNKELVIAFERIEELATRDPLTQCYNRRAMQEIMEREMAKQDRTHAPLAVIMFDLDHFKQINDQHGHAVGDAVLQQTAERIRSQLRRSGTLARMGGEEFLCILTDVDAGSLFQASERLRLTLCQSPLLSEPPLTVSASFGAVIRQPQEDLDSLLARADAAMYAAKHQGRNRVELG